MGYGNQREYEDRNWYYQPDRFDDRNRYNDKYPNRYGNSGYYQQQQQQLQQQPPQPQANRYDRPSSPAAYDKNDRNDYRQPSQDYRGNGYDNRDPIYYQQMKGSFYGNRGDAGGSGNGYGVSSGGAAGAGAGAGAYGGNEGGYYDGKRIY